ncbi:MAG: GSCFA domain-containing protein [Tabrizicola sp.]|jgi:hypothetical protein|nr:GSCFA domain-containing protein [Tabrizicola sp.]
MDKVSPYQGLDARAFWRTGLAETDYPPPDLYRPKWSLSKTDRIVTAGSCFAQHVGRALRQNGFNVLDAEPAPDGMAPDQALQHGYNMYSARYGNLYTTRQLRQLIEEAWHGAPWFDAIWERDGRYYDALRPNIQPNGFPTEMAVADARSAHLARVREVFSSADVFVFTLGLTEAWTHRSTGQVYATAPGTIAGTFDPNVHCFANFRVAEIRTDLEAALARLKELNPGLRILLTVSPVPLTATASGNHVLPATILSKSILRAVAGELAEDFPEVDYFPSYEIVTSTRAGTSFFEDNLRSVREAGVARVMSTFIRAHLEPTLAPVPAEPDRKALRAQRREARAAAQDASSGAGDRKTRRKANKGRA